MDTAAIVSLQALGPSRGSQSWAVTATYDSKSHQATLNNPYSDDEDEESLRWYLEDHPVDDPYSVSRAKETAASLEWYGSCLYSNLQPFLTALEIDPRVTPCVLQISGYDDGSTIHCLHWETLEQPSLKLQVVVCRVMGDGPKPSGVDTGRTGGGKPTVLFMTSRLIDDVVTDIDHLPALRGFLDAYSSLPDDIRGDFDVVRPGAFSSFRDALESKPPGYYDIVHLDVHGRVTEGMGAELRFIDENDWKEALWIHASKIASLLTDRGVKFVVLNACNSAKASSNVEANLAATFVGSGISGVVGMSYILTVSAAEIFTRAFYQSFLVRFGDIGVAAAQSRRALCIRKERLARFQMKIQLQDWIIPVVYLSKAALGSQAKDGSLRQVLQGSPTLSPPQSPILPASPSNALIGRDYDMFRLESYLAKHKAVELCGNIGVGKSSLIGTEWHSTTFAEVEFSWDLHRIIRNLCDNFSIFALREHLIEKMVNRSQRLTRPVLPEQEFHRRIRESARLELRQISGLFMSRRLLIKLDHVDDIFMILEDDEDETRSFIALLQEFQNIAKGTPNRFVLIVTSIPSNRTPCEIVSSTYTRSEYSLLSSFPPVTSPKIRTIAKSDHSEMKLLERFVQSLSGNPLVLKSYAKRFEASRLPTIRQFVKSAWTRSLEKTPEFIKGLRNSHSWTYADQLEELYYPDGIIPKSLLSLIYFNEHIPEDWNMFCGAIFESAPSAQEFAKFMTALREMCLVSKENGEGGWSVHPFLPLITETFYVNLRANMRKAFCRYYYWLLDLGLPSDEDENPGRLSATVSRSDSIKEAIAVQFVNISSMLWMSLDDLGQELLEELPSLALDSIITMHTHSLDRTSTDLYIVYALIDDYTKHINTVFSDWESRILASRTGSIAAQDTSHAMAVPNCNCLPVLLTLTLSFWLFGFHYNSGIAEESLLRACLKQAREIWAAYLRLFPDESHRSSFEAVVSHSDLLICEAALEIVLVNYSKARGLLNEARTVIQPRASAIENEQIQFRMQQEKCDYLEACIRQSEDAADSHEDSQSSTNFIESVQQFRDSSRQLFRSTGFVAYDFISRNLRSRQLWPDNAEDMFDEDPSHALSIAAPGIMRDRASQIRDTAHQDPNRSDMLTALEHFESTQNLPDRFVTLLTFAVEAERRNDQQQALLCYERALQCIDSWSGANATEKSFLQSGLHLDMGHIALQERDYVRAVGFFHQAYEEARHSGNGPQERLLLLRIFMILQWFKWPETIDWERICGLTEREVSVQLLILQYEPMIWECSLYRRLISRGKLEMRNFRQKIERERDGRYFLLLYSNFIDNTMGNEEFRLSQASSETITLIATEIGTGVRDVETFISDCVAPALWRLRHRRWPSADEFLTQFDKLFLEAELALFAPTEMRTGFSLIDREYETMVSNNLPSKRYRIKVMILTCSSRA
ncbi:hypothetical protein MHUMG1_10606 [Metarhizium humberi]|uniref:CHAT domain-containing protein n=1 Tax=Metarhizium humberi TaxID=2596975 RepID=A0A9P8M0V7_9HYPO|nr:hypothetical protein MHUMG1_10606 [Metarhizium humberi]